MSLARLLVVSLTPLAFLTGAGRAVAQQELFKLTASDGAAEDYFGHGVSLGEDGVLVGAYGADDNGAMSGSAYLFHAATGQQLTKLLPLDGAADDQFGFSVSVGEGRAVVGAWGDDHGSDANAGSAHVFDVTTGLQLFKLVALDFATEDAFGLSVSVSGDRAVIGAPYDDDQGSRSGAAYVFDVTTGQQLSKLLPTDGAANDFFGYSVSISGNKALVGALNDSDNGFFSGSAYVFDVMTGQQLSKLLPLDGAPTDYFGNSVSISGERAVVGAYYDDDHGGNSGSAYVFDAASGQQIFKLLPADGAAFDWFGFSVAVDADRAVVGAYGDNDVGGLAGSSYVFDVTTGQQMYKLLASDGEQGDFCGRSVAIRGDRIVAGAHRHDHSGSDAGAAYVFDPTASIHFTETILDTDSVPDTGGVIAQDEIIYAKLGVNQDDLFKVGGGLPPTLLAGGPGDQTDAAADLSYAVFADNSLGNSNIAGVDLVTGEFQFWVTDPGLDADPAISGTNVVFRTNRTGSRDIWFLDLTTGLESPLATGLTIQSRPAVDGDLVAWEQFEGDFNLYAQFLGGTPFPVSIGAEIALAPSVSGDLIAFIEDDDISVFDVSTGQTSRITEDLFLQSGVRIDGQHLAWTGDRNGNLDVFLHDLALGVTFQLTTDPSDQIVTDLRVGTIAIQDYWLGNSNVARIDYVIDHPPGLSFCFGDGTGMSCPCSNHGGIGEGCANSSGVGSRLTAIGTASSSADDVEFEAGNLLVGQPALLFAGEIAVNEGIGLTFGDGLRCAGLNVVRLGVMVPDSNGDASWGPGLRAGGGWSSGDTRYFQAWYRDPSGSPCGSGFNLTNGVEVTFT